MPRRAMPCGGVPAMSRPSKTIRPDVGASGPVHELKSVVLPAPLGPMTECSAPSSTANVTASTATRAPKDFVSRSVLTRGMTPRPVSGPCLDDPTAKKQHHDDEGHAEQKRPARPDRAAGLR